MKYITSLLYTRPQGLAIGWTLVIFLLCATPGQYIPSPSWLELLSFDKFVHAAMFCVLGLLWLTYGWRSGRGHGFVVLVVAGAVLYGAALELMQATWFSNRSADWKDIVANSFGCVVALLLHDRWRKCLQWLGAHYNPPPNSQ